MNIQTVKTTASVFKTGGVFKKALAAALLCFFAGGMLAAQQAGSETARQAELLEIAKEEILIYFRRYKPRAEIKDNTVQGSARFGKYDVSIEVVPSGANRYSLKIVSRVDEAYIAKWEANLRKNINARL